MFKLVEFGDDSVVLLRAPLLPQFTVLVVLFVRRYDHQTIVGASGVSLVILVPLLIFIYCTSLAILKLSNRSSFVIIRVSV